TDLDIRSLTGGTGSLSSYADGFDSTDVDSIAIHGMSLGYPVGTRLYAGSGATIVPIGVSANALDVNIIGTDTVVNVDITDTQFMVSGNSTGDFVRVSGTGGGAVVIAGLEGATAIAVTGGGQPLAITGGASPLPVQGSDFDIRGLTFDGSVNDVVGISGPMFETLSGMSSDVGGISTGIDEIRTWMENTNTHGATLPNAGQLASLIGKDFALESSGNLAALRDGMTGEGVGKGMRVFVVDNIQPPTLFNGQTTVPTSTAVALSTTQPIKSGVNIKAHQQNTASVFVGAGGVGVETGYPLSAGEEIFLEVNNIITPFVIASSAGQTACWTAS
ncbi:MAG: hypothetical protein H8D80_02100, partial [Proteobacteria bacterium]|nr:hypothetical protein [Pseudomonadota bacterium]